jgi:IS605 OrfB family transposase
MPKLTYHTKLIFDSDSDKESVFEVMSWQKLAFNECSKKSFELKKNSIVDLHKVFYADFRLSQAKIPSQIVITAQRECLAHYKAAKSNKHRLKKPVEKKNLSIQLDKRLFSVRKNGDFSLISSKGRVKCRPYIYDKLAEYWGKYKVCDPHIFEKDGEIWIGLVFNIPEAINEKTLATGIDLGVRQFAVSSEGVVYDDKKFKKEKRRLRYLKRCLQGQAAKGSRSAKRHLKKLRRKERNKNKDFTHKICNQILESVKGNVVAVENLKGLKKKKHKGENKNAISQVPIYEFVQVLEYKALAAGKTMVKVDPRFTSQIDSRNGKMSGERKGRRYYGKDGKVLDADINAAINIAKRTKLPVSFVKPLDGLLKPFGQADVNQPYDCQSDCLKRVEPSAISRLSSPSCVVGS